jgi:hypothetical protein
MAVRKRPQWFATGANVRRGPGAQMRGLSLVQWCADSSRTGFPSKPPNLPSVSGSEKQRSNRGRPFDPPESVSNRAHQGDLGHVTAQRRLCGISSRAALDVMV